MVDLATDIIQKKHSRRFLLLPLLLVAFGCASRLSEQGLLVKEATAEQVKNCEFLGTVTASSGWGGLAANAGMQSVVNQLKNKAGQLGSTHIVLNYVAGGYTPTGTAAAHRCR